MPNTDQPSESEFIRRFRARTEQFSLLAGGAAKVTGNHTNGIEAEPSSKTNIAHEVTRPRRWAKSYLDRGWQPVALHPKQKTPIAKGWQSRPLKSEDLVDCNG